MANIYYDQRVEYGGNIAYRSDRLWFVGKEPEVINLITWYGRRAEKLSAGEYNDLALRDADILEGVNLSELSKKQKSGLDRLSDSLNKLDDLDQLSTTCTPENFLDDLFGYVRILREDELYTVPKEIITTTGASLSQYDDNQYDDNNSGIESIFSLGYRQLSPGGANSIDMTEKLIEIGDKLDIPVTFIPSWHVSN